MNNSNDQIIIRHDEYEELKEKADKWDRLHEAIDKYYEEDSEGDLIDIGETAAHAFGYL